MQRRVRKLKSCAVVHHEEVHPEKTKGSRPSVPDGVRSKASKSVSTPTESVSRGRTVTDKLEKVGTNMDELHRIPLKRVQLPRPVYLSRVLSLPQSEIIRGDLSRVGTATKRGITETPPMITTRNRRRLIITSLMRTERTTRSVAMEMTAVSSIRIVP